MRADIKGALQNINKYWKVFEHKGKSMTKAEVKAVLTYALSQGYKTTEELTDFEVDEVLKGLAKN